MTMSDSNADFTAVNRFVGTVVGLPAGAVQVPIACDTLRAVARELLRLYAADVDRENLEHEGNADTKRLDWLSANGWAEIVDVEDGVQVGDVYAPEADTRTLRDAIDEAMRTSA